MANAAESLPSSSFTPVQILALKDSLKASIDKESNIDLLQKCAMLLSLDKDTYDLSRAITMKELLSMVKEDVHSMIYKKAPLEKRTEVDFSTSIF